MPLLNTAFAALSTPRAKIKHVDALPFIVFNWRMNDKDLIDHLGGPASLAKLLGYRTESGTQRVHNWKARGIPAQVKMAHPELLMPALMAKLRKQAKRAK